MFVSHRVSTWPLNQGRPHLDNGEDQDRLIWALIPVSLLDDHRVREAYSRALVNNWLGRHGRTSYALDIDLPFLVELSAYREGRTSLRPEASSENSEPVPNSPTFPNTSPPVTASREESSATLGYVGYAFPGIVFPGHRLPISEGSRTPTSQSAISLSSRYLYRQVGQSRPSTPSFISSYVSWAHPNSIEHTLDPVRHNQRSSGDSSDQSWTGPGTRADSIGTSEDHSQVRHFATPLVQHDRMLARLAPGEFAQKRGRSPNSEASASNTSAQRTESSPNNKRRRVAHEDQEDEDVLEDDNQSPFDGTIRSV